MLFFSQGKPVPGELAGLGAQDLKGIFLLGSHQGDIKLGNSLSRVRW